MCPRHSSRTLSCSSLHFHAQQSQLSAALCSQVAGSTQLPHIAAQGLLALVQHRSVLSEQDVPETLLLDMPALVGLQNKHHSRRC